MLQFSLYARSTRDQALLCVFFQLFFPQNRRNAAFSIIARKTKETQGITVLKPGCEKCPDAKKMILSRNPAGFWPDSFLWNTNQAYE
jgi:hypothetical protein